MTPVREKERTRARPAAERRRRTPAPGDEAATRQRSTYVLRLYVTGASRLSRRAIAKVREVCERDLQGQYELEVIDIYQLPVLAKDEQIVATPTLIRVLPRPLRRFIGDLSKADNLIFGLDLRPRP